MSKPPKPPRNHHYVPQLLLRRFAAADGTLWVYDLAKSETYPAQPKSGGFARDIYSRMGSDGSSDHAHVENLLAQRVDKPGDAAIGATAREGRPVHNGTSVERFPYLRRRAAPAHSRVFRPNEQAHGADGAGIIRANGEA